MTYTFKLARRLAVSREYTMLAAMVVLVACAGETTAPDAAFPPQPPSSIGIRVVPGTVTIETNQQIRFRGERRGPRGEVLSVPLSWEASGGTIDARGNFAAAASGTYKVVGRGRGRHVPDTSVVVVVPPQPDLTGVSVSPGTVTLAPSSRHPFTATGIRSDGTTTTAIGVIWQATGGTIDAGGVYAAGTEPGAFRVIATHPTAAVADTATVTIPAPSLPAFVQVVIRPASVSLVAGASRQFAAYGRNGDGDSVVVTAAFSATGGTITASGLYTAGQTAGTYRVIASSSGIADTAVVTLAAPPPAPAPPPAAAPPAVGVGIPFGPAQMPFSGPGDRFTMRHDGVTASNLLSRIDAARAGKFKLLLNLTGGSHDNYMSVIEGVYQFDRAKWKARMDAYNTAAIRQAVAAAVADGTIIGNSVMDEPHVSGAGDGNTWGPAGTMTKARVDSLCSYAKGIFPTLPEGVAHRHDIFEPAASYRVCEFIITQYSSRLGSVTAFRDGALAMAKRDGIAMVFGMNILNGGTQDRDGTWDCAGTGGRGTYSPNCRMTPSQVREYGLTLGPSGCGFKMWRYDSAFMSDPENQRAFSDVAGRLATLPGRSCRRQ